MRSVVAVVGPTGVGKSALAVKLAQDVEGEIISADSRQIYRYMDIGTAKPTAAEQSLVPHHLINIVDPDQGFNLAQYKEMAYKAIEDTQSRGHLPILVGGSGLYIWATLEGWQIPMVAPDIELRKRLEERAANGEAQALYCELIKLDPDAANRIDPRNIRRVIRALEIKQNSQTTLRAGKTKPPFDELIIGLTASREKLYQRIDERIDDMVYRGLVEEVTSLVKMGYDLALPSMSGIGYHQIGFYIQGEISLEESIQQVKYESHRLVRQQYNWFSLKDDRIKWFDINMVTYTHIKAMVSEFLKE
jgi:tRNA dimethylallyltransferase